jgi:acyl-coenzyme A thioesterase PaaI-like protein
VAAAIDHARCSRQPAVGYDALAAVAFGEDKDKVIRVGPDRSVKTPAAAANMAVDGSIIMIDAADYSGGVASWPQHDLTIVGVGGRPHIKADAQAIAGRDIWLFTGDNIVVENIEFSGARSSTSFNGAGIRHTGSNLTVRHGYFHDSDNGILTWKSPGGVIIIEHSEFARNGYGDGQSHNVYIGETERLEFRYNYSHASKEGHLLKSRARVNHIRNNRLTGEEGEVSYVINLPNGGVAYIVGNVMEKAVVSGNPYVISYGEEGLNSADNRLFVMNNSVYNRYDKTVFIRNASEQPAFLVNNLLGGATMGIAEGEHKSEGNLALPEHGMRDPRNYDFELIETAAAINTGIALSQYGDEDFLTPSAEYVHPVSRRDRRTVHRIDIGAHEYCAY